MPFAINRAVEINAHDDGTRWTYSGNWVARNLDFAQGEYGDTEFRLPWSITNINGVQMILIARDVAGEVFATFPTSNPLEVPWQEGYVWADPCTAQTPNTGLPQGDQVEILFDAIAAYVDVAATSFHPSLSVLDGTIRTQDAPALGQLPYIHWLEKVHSVSLSNLESAMSLGTDILRNADTQSDGSSVNVTIIDSGIATSEAI